MIELYNRNKKKIKKMNSFVFLFLLIGIMMMFIGYLKSNQSCPPPIVEYRYIPRSFEDEQVLETPVLSIFGKMFSDVSPWEREVGYSTFSEQTTLRNLKPSKQ
jgi:hypothetical protein